MKYKVRSGDTLSGIAKAHDILGGWKELWLRNRDVVGGDPDHIEPGTSLEVPFDLQRWARNLITFKKVTK